MLEFLTEEKLKIVITDYRFPDVEQERRAVEAAGGTLVTGQAANEDQVAELCRDADGVLTARAPITRRAISAMQRCRIIVRYGIGVDTVDVAAATERGILVANVPDYCLDEVSDHALTLLLMLSRQMISAIALAREDTWAVAKMPPLQRLRGQTCGLIGCGRIGSLLAGKVKQLGMSVIIHDPYLSEPRAREMGAELVSLDALLARGFYFAARAAQHSHASSPRRSGLRQDEKNRVDHQHRARRTDRRSCASRRARCGKISGAALDVLESETAVTPVRSALVRHPKMIVTAHTAWLSEQARATLQLRAIEQVLACLKGETPYGLINRELAK